ncbi:hypothetical protein [Microvirga terrestris]|uniref:Uncharacterized protein n=1 Tax=Microvirga terrestris TaxID=2791024 RepID=A0ABS0HPY0_9HYPH|nr:hypothetical protein [Microvirga terrestris]MBF9195536.1 hypothetical protein [Microvirga terrestris]
MADGRRTLPGHDPSFLSGSSDSRIVPMHRIARTLCILEAVIGQLYPATPLERIVTLEMRQGGG